MMNAPSLKLLRDFIQTPCYATASMLIHIPALYNVLQYELQNQAKIPSQIINICKWLWIRGETVSRQFLIHKTAESDSDFDNDAINWGKVHLCLHLSV